MLRKITVMIAGLLLVTLVSCGGSKQNETQNQNQPAATQQPAAQSQAEQLPTQAQTQTAEPSSRSKPAPRQTEAEKAATRHPGTYRGRGPGSEPETSAPGGKLLP
jgi:hypothetical protein